MIKFLLKKSFYDLWDNLFSVLLLNLGFIALTALPFLSFSFLSDFRTAPLFLFAGIVLCSVYLTAASHTFAPVSDHESLRFSDFPKNLKATFRAGLVFGALNCGLILILFIVIPFYLKMKSPAGLFLSALVFWVFTSAAVALQFFPAVHRRLRCGSLTAIKKCFIIFFDNTAFCFFVFLHNIIIFPLSVFLLFLAPGPAGIILFLDEALRLRLLKYDRPENNTPGANRRRVPWNDILKEERELTGTRTLRAFIFPWKT